MDERINLFLKWRLLAGMSRKELAEAAGVSVAIVRTLENGAYLKTIKNIGKISRALGKDWHAFFEAIDSVLVFPPTPEKEQAETKVKKYCQKRGIPYNPPPKIMPENTAAPPPEPKPEQGGSDEIMLI